MLLLVMVALYPRHVRNPVDILPIRRFAPFMHDNAERASKNVSHTVPACITHSPNSVSVCPVRVAALWIFVAPRLYVYVCAYVFREEYVCERVSVCDWAHATRTFDLLNSRLYGNDVRAVETHSPVL